ncbi:hypothetical protein ACBJ59_10460 [Nonomuraea sp. MTCD27]|uniref:hypothetical protein n=1 Tax=Nonomuraea sp. MTCD27 TaxID=1676747 RepID=UPI0035C0007D
MARSAAPPPLAKVEVPFPADWAALNRARRRVDVVRSATGRLATLAGAAAAAAGLFTGDVTGVGLMGTAALTLGGLVSLRLWKPDGHQKATATVLYLMPGTSLAALLVVEQFTPGIHPVATPVEAAALAVWTAGVWALRPAWVGRRMVSPPRSRSLEVAAPPAPEPGCDHPAAGWWAHTVAIAGGPGPATALEAVERTGETAMRAIIRSTMPGKPVPNIPIKDLSALMDVPEDDISIGPVPGRGAGVRLLQVGQPDEDRGPAAVWANRIAPTAMPGTVLTGVRTGRPAVHPDEEG